MELPGQNEAWAFEREAHQTTSAEGDPSPSGRALVAIAGPEPRSSASLPRLSRSGEGPVVTGDGYAPGPAISPMGSLRASLNLRARAPGIGTRSMEPNRATAEPSAVAGPVLDQRKSRRASIAEFLGFGGNVHSAAPSPRSREPHAGPIPNGAGSVRRASLLQTLGLSTATVVPEDNDASFPATPVGDGDGGRSKSVGGMAGAVSSSRRARRASLVDLFSGKPSRQDTEQESVDTPGRQLKMSKSDLQGSRKSRRASVIDFLTGRGSQTGLTDGDVGGQSLSRSSRALTREGTNNASRNRRRSVIDILGQSSKKVFAKLMNHEFEEEEDGQEVDEGPLWFTSLNDFKPLTFKYLSGRYSSAFFACSVKTGEHYILKQFEKGKMEVADERGVRRALAFAQMLEHEHIVRCCGTWEDEKALYIVEEYATKGDLLQDSMSHPEKYTEAFMATRVIKPLLEVLVYLHNINVVHRAIFPEYVLFGREDKLKLGHFTSAVDQRLDPPNERIHFLDYMAPEMLSVREEAAQPGARQALHPNVTKVVRMQGFSNDGSSGQPGRAPPSPHSPQPPGLPVVQDASSRGVRPLPSVHGRSSRAGDAPWLTPVAEPSDVERSTRGAASRRPSFLDGQAPFGPEDRSVGRRQDRGGSAPDDAWGLPMESSNGSAMSRSGTRRRKSAMDEMDAPWLRPVSSSSGAAPDMESGAACDLAMSPGDAPCGGAGADLRSPSRLPESPSVSAEHAYATGTGVEQAGAADLQPPEQEQQEQPQGEPSGTVYSTALEPMSRELSTAGPVLAVEESMHADASTGRREAGAAGAGPAAEALEPDGAQEDDDVVPLKRHGRSGVSFSQSVAQRERSLLSPPRAPPAHAAPSWSGSRPLSSGLASREQSATAASSAAQVMSGLRSLAKNFTLRIGRALGGAATEPQLSMPFEGPLAEMPNPSVKGPTPRESDAGADSTSIFVPTNPWEWQDHYTEKVDIWQVGCLMHEILCMSLPFEAEDKLLACALILWADVVSFPENLSPECHTFIQACLTKNPAERPSAAELLQHPWITRHASGDALKSVRQLREDAGEVDGVNGEELTWLQRMAARVGMGWLVGVGSSSGDAGGPWAWLRKWTARVLPASPKDEGQEEFEKAMAMVVEQNQSATQAVLGAHRPPDLETGGARKSQDAAGARKSAEGGGARRSLEAGGVRRSLEAGGVRKSAEAPGTHRPLDAGHGGGWGALI